jgi:hypothetical protein
VIVGSCRRATTVDARSFIVISVWKLGSLRLTRPVAGMVPLRNEQRLTSRNTMEEEESTRLDQRAHAYRADVAWGLGTARPQISSPIELHDANGHQTMKLSNW